MVGLRKKKVRIFGVMRSIINFGLRYRKYIWISYRTEGNKHLLTSVEGRSWKGVLWADWKDNA